MRRVLITGVGGFIGQHLARSLSHAGYSVAGTFHTRHIEMEQASWLAGLYRMSLDGQSSYIDFSAFDIVIHLAFDLRKGRSDTNYEGTIRIAEAAHDGGVSRQLFVSSYSARPDAISEYGQAKFRLERYFLDTGYEIVRPGLVLGNGGIVARIISTLKASPIIPLPSGGKGEVPVISIDVLCEAMRKILEHPGNREHNLFSQHFTSLKLLIQTLQEVVCKSQYILLVPIPSTLILKGLQLAEALRLPIPVNADSLKGFMRNQERLHESTLDALGVKSEALIEAVKAANLH
jgi:nucleoside-diphosphate-sugar epimerase